MFPGLILQLSYWYRPDEIAVRVIWICKRTRICDVSGGWLTNYKLQDSFGNVAGIIGGFLAYGFHAASGAGGLSGWQW